MTEASRSEGSILQGMLLCWGMNAIQVFGGCSAAMIEGERHGGSNTVVYMAGLMALSVGVLQLLYVIPTRRALERSGKTQSRKGVAIAAWITALLNAVWFAIKAAQ